MKKLIFVPCLFLLVGYLGCATAKESQLTSKIQDGFLEQGNYKRTYLYYAPENLKGRKNPLSLVLLLHGGGGKPESMVKLTFGRFNELADRDGFIVVYPAGVEGHWNDDRGVALNRAERENIDDVGFLSALIDLFRNRYGVDSKRVYVTGISNGAMMSCRVACELSDKIAAAAPVAGSVPKKLLGACSSKNPVSMLFINGDADPLVPFEGGQVHLWRRSLGEIMPVRDAALFWAKRDGCRLPALEVLLPDRAPKDGTTARKLDYRPGPTGPEVVLYVIHGGGHTWPMGWRYLRPWLVGRVSRELDASDVIWDFFKAHPRK